MMTAISVVFPSATLIAGYKAPASRITVTNYANGDIVASGIMGDARASSDNIRQLGCSISATMNSTSPEVMCFASTYSGSVGLSAACWTSNPFFIEQVKSINRYSRITFRADSQKKCTFLEVINGSSFNPMVP